MPASGDLRHAKRRALAGNLILARLGKILVGIALVGSFGDGRYFGVGAEDHNHASEFSLVLLKVFLFFNVDADALAGDNAVRARGPGLSVDEKGDDIGRGHANVGVLVGPSAAEGTPGFEVSVTQAHGSELVASPFVGALHVGGSGEAFADRIHQAGGVFHHFGIAKALVADARDGFEVNFFLSLLGTQSRNDGQNDDERTDESRGSFYGGTVHQ